VTPEESDKCHLVLWHAERDEEEKEEEEVRKEDVAGGRCGT